MYGKILREDDDVFKVILEVKLCTNYFHLHWRYATSEGH